MRDVQIQENDWVLVQTDLLSSAAKWVRAKFKPKFEGPYRVLEKKSQERGNSDARYQQVKFEAKKRGKGEFRSSSEKRTHQRRSVRSRGRREQQYSSYSVEQGRSCGLSARSRRAQQQQRQEVVEDRIVRDHRVCRS
ncbi:hypothetical protein TNCV_1795061 [Trichonephila clavipes]|nr:hypothetical protein TNCV_1795061 [Trichonephila clavipes]